MDYEGLVASFKHPLDALVSAGVLEDDSWYHIGKPNYDWVYLKKKPFFIEIFVEETHERQGTDSEHPEETMYHLSGDATQ